MNKLAGVLFSSFSETGHDSRLLRRGRFWRGMALALSLAWGGSETAWGQINGLYWQCVQPSSTSPSGGYCPAGTAYPVPVAQSAASVGGGSVFRSVTLTNTAVAVDASPGTVSFIHVANTGSAPALCYLQVYNVAAAGVTVGTTVPTITLAVAAATAVSLPFNVPVQFGTAISVAATTTPGGGTACSPILTATVVEFK